MRLSRIILKAMHHVIRNDKRGPVRPTGISQTHGSKDRSKTSLSISMSYLLQRNLIFQDCFSRTFQHVKNSDSYASIIKLIKFLFCNSANTVLLKINFLGTINSLSYQMWFILLCETHLTCKLNADKITVKICF